MTNFEKYKNELLEDKFAISKKTNELKFCSELKCIDCKHSDGEWGGIACVKAVLKWGFKEAKFELNGRQRAFCEMVETGWLARDINGDLYYYRDNAPINEGGIWYKKEGHDKVKLISGFDMFPDFPFITWMNSPVSIKELMN